MDTSYIVLVVVGILAIAIIFRILSLAVKLLVLGAIIYAVQLAYRTWRI